MNCTDEVKQNYTHTFICIRTRFYQGLHYYHCLMQVRKRVAVKVMSNIKGERVKDATSPGMLITIHKRGLISLIKDSSHFFVPLHSLLLSSII